MELVDSLFELIPVRMPDLKNFYKNRGFRDYIEYRGCSVKRKTTFFEGGGGLFFGFCYRLLNFFLLYTSYSTNLFAVCYIIHLYFFVAELTKG